MLLFVAAGTLEVGTTFSGALAGGEAGLTGFFALGFAGLASFADFDAGMDNLDARTSETGCANQQPGAGERPGRPRSGQR
ncbi:MULTISPECIES: hypothetical protein [Ramlibacter]|uniref:hypothetical protein n=1 Tax=Ramlibacter TaxID=174951 RepID=UPI001E4B024E|nr:MULTISPECIES: hypothetical protein [Ramlibacter]